MNWLQDLQTTGAQWNALMAYVEARTAELTAVCVSLGSNDADIRAAQAGIVELDRLRGLPAVVKRTADLATINNAQRQGY